MDSVATLYKKAGETPLMCITRWQEQNPQYAGMPVTYAGRLDPLADGVLIALYGDTVHKKDFYLQLEKKYEIEILFGITSDTQDVLGLPTASSRQPSAEHDLLPLISSTIPTFLGAQRQIYPVYSSKPVQGKPLFWWARNNLLSQIKIPSHDIYIHEISLQSYKTICGSNLLRTVRKNIADVSGDFRQKELIDQWETELAGKEHAAFPIVRLLVRSSAGAYMRMLAYDIGQAFGIPSLALSITRTAVGGFTLAQITENLSHE